MAITGQRGFIGSHLYNYLKYISSDVDLLPFEDSFFEDGYALKEICSKADVIIHLAALNRHHDPEEIYRVNVGLVRKLIDACASTSSKPHIIFASSTQEQTDSAYGRSKREGRGLLESWARENGARFTVMIIPNVFGPFGVPFYNSVISTFSYQLTHGEKGRIEVDRELKLVYVGTLVREFYSVITEDTELSPGGWVSAREVAHDSVSHVSGLLATLVRFKEEYFQNGVIPQLRDSFELNLFNTFRSYFPSEKFPFGLPAHTDERGAFVEILKANTSGQVSYSTTRPGITRGNHFHTRKIERFMVLKGKAKIELRRVGTAQVVTYFAAGDTPSFVDMPVWYTHNITNMGEDELMTLFWTNEVYNPKDPDTFYQKV